MTKTKAQLRAEAVERLKNSVGARLKPDAAVIAIVGGRIGLADWSLECDKLIDLLTDDCGPCYSCAKLAELRAENNALRAAIGRKATESDVMVVGMGANGANADSRDELVGEAHLEAGYAYGRGFANGLADAWNDAEVGAIANRTVAMLDRQAAITKREREQHWLEIVGASANCNLELTNKIAELTAQLEASRRALEINHGTWKYYCDRKGGFIDRVEICKMKKCPYGGGK